jgi:DNA-binding NtrC family response regulator
VGSNKSVRVDVRVIAATHRDLEALVEQGRFRQDLYYRLKVVELWLPPLRERLEDLPALAQRFIGQACERFRLPERALAPAALRRLMRHRLPGNVRELKSILEQACVLAAGDEISEADLGLAEARSSELAAPAFVSGLPFAEAKQRAVESFERSYLSEALSRHDGNVSRTAEALGMLRQSLQQKLKELGLRPTKA